MISIETKMRIKCITQTSYHPFHAHVLNRFSIMSIQGMVTQPTALKWVGVFKNKFENIITHLKTLPYEEYKLVI